MMSSIFFLAYSFPGTKVITKPNHTWFVGSFGFTYWKPGAFKQRATPDVLNRRNWDKNTLNNIKWAKCYNTNCPKTLTQYQELTDSSNHPTVGGVKGFQLCLSVALVWCAEVPAPVWCHYLTVCEVITTHQQQVWRTKQCGPNSSHFQNKMSINKKSQPITDSQGEYVCFTSSQR